MNIEHLSAAAARDLVAQAERRSEQAVLDSITLAHAKRLEAASQAAMTGLALYRELIKSIATYANLKRRELEWAPVSVWSLEERELGRYAVDFAVDLLRADLYEVEVKDVVSDREEYDRGGWVTWTLYMIRLTIRW